MVDPVDSKRDKKRDPLADAKVTAADAESLVRGRPVVLSRDDFALDDKDDDDDDYDDDYDDGDDDDYDDDVPGKSSSRTTRRLKDIEHRVSKAFRRLARAVDHGTSEYIDARDKSADNRSDGALVDFYENVAKGASKTISEASPVLTDVAEAFNTEESRRQFRRFLKNLPRLPIIG
jgi:hypothetical protein